VYCSVFLFRGARYSTGFFYKYHNQFHIQLLIQEEEKKKIRDTLKRTGKKENISTLQWNKQTRHENK